jgi:hypothetical protein
VTKPRLAQDRGSRRLYQWRDESFWSVTTIIGGGLPKPVLVNWAKKFTAEYAVDNLEKLNALCAPDSDGGIDREGAVDWLKGAAFRDRDKKADIGTAVHEATEAYVLGKPMPPWTPLIKPRMAAFEKFLADLEPEYDAGMVEASVFNRAEKYAGTLDAILDIDGRKLLMDVKTGGKDIYPEVALQLAAYRYAEFIGAPDGSEVPMPEVDGCVALHLPDAGDYSLIEVRADEEVFRAFLYVREVFRFASETYKTVLLGPYGTRLLGEAA